MTVNKLDYSWDLIVSLNFLISNDINSHSIRNYNILINQNTYGAGAG